MYAFFIRRPIVAICLSLIILMGGIISALSLPIAQYPDIIPPQVSITTSYPGADCFTVVDSVASPIEQQMSGVQDMDYMTSTSTNEGALTINVLFDVGTSAKMDQVLSYLRYAQSSAQLPTEVQEMGVTMHTIEGTPMLIYALTSPNDDYDNLWMANYAYTTLVNPLLRTKGVGNVAVYGSGKYAMRVWLLPDRMAALGITVSEIETAIQAQNCVKPMGKIGGQPTPDTQLTTYTVRSSGRLETVVEFEEIVVRSEGDAQVCLKDVARVELGGKNYDLDCFYNGKVCAILAVTQSPGSNALETVAGVEKTLANFKLPPNLELHQVLNTTVSVKLGIEEIVETLALALLLVMVVVFIFLQGWRASLIPLATVPVSIVGTFIVFPFFGMEINTICLMGLVLAVGLVVDDAIVVVEAVQTRLDDGLSPLDATHAAMKEVAGPVVTTALVLSAVFFPCMLLPGITGMMFSQFAVTIGISILISAFCALSLSPALAALLLRPKKEGHSLAAKAGNGFNRCFSRIRLWYLSLSGWLIRRGVFSAILLMAVVWGLFPAAKLLPSSFLPGEDEGYFFGTLQMPYGTALPVTAKSTAEIAKLIKDNESVEAVVSVNGLNMMTGVESPNNAFFFINLKPWSERNPKTQSAQVLSKQLIGEMAALDTGGIGFSMTPPPIPGVGMSADVSIMLEDRAGRGEDYLAANTELFIATAEKRPEIGMVMNFMASDTPQYFLKLDEKKALMQGVDLDDAYDTLQCFLGSVFVDYFNRFGYQWDVYMQADADARMNPEALKQFYLPGSDGVQVPLDSIVSLERSSGPGFLIRQNMYNASMLEVVGADGYSSGQVMAALEEVFNEVMPSDMGYGYTGMSYQENKAAQGLGIATLFLLSGIFAYLLLASLYESWLLPLAVFISLPIAILGAFLTMHWAKQDLNIYTEIGLIMLIGLTAKNAILVVEFAQNRLTEGMGVLHAALLAARVRLRPILMTSLAFMMGCIPLVLASGAGASARQAVGYCVIGGMATAAFICIFFNPFAYYLIAKLRGRKSKQTEA